MKKSKNNTDNDLVTKKYLNQRLTKNTSEILDYVNTRFNAVDERFEKIDQKFENVNKKLDNILKTLDWLVKNYQELKDEHTVSFEQYRRIDNRVTVLEKRVFAS